MSGKMKLAVSILALAFAAPGLSPAADLDGLSIFREAARRDSGYQDFQAAITMTLKDKSGKETRRLMKVSNLEGKAEGPKTMLRFENPPDVKGTVLLTHTHRTGADEQWIYLPAFKKAKKISDANKTSPFMASEFSYEDINSVNIEVAKFTYAYRESADLGGLRCHVVERKPAYPNSGYARQVVWLDTAAYLIRKVEYFDKDGAHAKTLAIQGYEKYPGGFWRAREMAMVNHKNGSSTVLAWTGYAFRSGLREGDFALAALKQ